MVNLVIPFFLIAYGVQKVQSNLAAILMASSPLSATDLAHFFTKNEKINYIKIFGVLLGLGFFWSEVQKNDLKSLPWWKPISALVAGADISAHGTNVININISL